MRRANPPQVQRGVMPSGVPTVMVYDPINPLSPIARSEAPNSNINNRTKDRPFRFNPYAIWENNRPIVPQ